MPKFIIVGHGGSGKDYLAKKFIKKGSKKSVSYTTRPPRKGEVDGIDYNFISVEDFKKKTEEGFWYEYDLFKPEEEWYYGQSKEDIENCDLFIKTVKGVSKIKKEDRNKFIVIYLNIEESIRLERLMLREDADDSNRRIMSDRKDFENFSDYDIMISNMDF